MANSKARRVALGATAIVALGAALAAAPAAAVVINDGFTPGDIVDPNNITGVGQMVTDEQNGFIGLCTATLINPRTVILAAHCVNELPASAYGSANGGHAIGVGFQADNLSSINDWFQSSFQTNKTDQFYNGSYVTYNQHSLDTAFVDGSGTLQGNFLQGDVALIAFDTPVTGVPTTDLLFSPLTGPVHATITGYGDNGTGTTGQGDLDFKRRVAENIVSVLGSLDDVDTFLFGSPDGLPQNLYQIDFNDPKFGTAGANPFDFDLFGDKALGKEGITAPGDSGGPLLIDQAFAKPVIAGVLSGGSRYFDDQPGASYGTSSFYQPLYLFWDWIVANNPYKYVGAKAGDGSWTDPNHWVMNLDPIYQVIGADGQLVNGLPSTPAASIDGTSPKFGKVCYLDTCEDLSTGAVTTGNTPTNPASISNDKGKIKLSDTGAIHEAQDAPDQMVNSPSAVIPPVGNPPAEGSADVGGELVQGAPGSSNFVPSDTDGDITTGAPARYYDVTLSADGTTTLSGAQIVIDRLTLSGANAGLTIDADAGLASLIDTTQLAGTMTVNGQYVTIGDYDLIGGLLQGTGTVIAPNLISVMGSIAPGGLGTIGTLTVAGNVIMSSASRTYIDVGPNGTSDHLAIVNNPFIDPAAANALTGVGDLGGLLAINPVNGYRPTYGDTFTLITAQGGLQDQFDAVAGLSAILYPSITQTADTLSITIKARPYSSVINQGSPIQKAYASLLDRSRSSAALEPFYFQSDMLSQAAIQSSLEAAAPYAQQTEVGLVRMQDEALAKFYRDRLALLRSGGASEQLAVLGNPLGVVRSGYQTAQDVAMGLMQAPTGQQSTAVPLPEGVSAYLAGGYLDGSARPLPNLISGKKDDLSGWYVAGGIEKQIDDKTITGMSASYSHGKGDTLFGERANSDIYQLAAYGTYSFGDGAFVNTSVSGGLLQIKTRRQFGLGDATAKLRNEESAPIFSGEIALGYDLKTTNFTLTPLASIRGSHLEFEGGQESGLGSLIYAKRDFNSLQARIGGRVAMDMGNIHPHVDAAFVHDFRKNGEDIFAHFTGADVPNADFGSFGRDQNWGEVGGGLTVAGPKMDIGVSADTVFKRQDLSYQVYRGSVTFHF
jgi:uncharacterized protein YhjY with autotransporter beta-barrel domain